jgi:general secretion pathway protein L
VAIVRTSSFEVSGLRTRIADCAQAFLSWWRGELTACIPLSWREALAVDARTFVMRLADDRIELREGKRSLTRAGRTETVVAMCDLHTLPEALACRRGLSNWIAPVIVRVPLSWCLQRQLTMPLAARARLEAILALDLERATPFRRTEVFSGSLPPVASGEGPSSLLVTQLVLKAQRIEPLLNAMSAKRISCAGVEVESFKGDVLPIRLKRSGGVDIETPRALKALDITVRVLAIALCASLALSIALALDRQKQALAALRSEAQVLQKQLSNARLRASSDLAARNEAASVRSRKIAQSGFLEILEDVSRALPDDAWISELQFSSDGVLLDGQARAAAELIGLLSSVPGFSDVSFVAPVTRDPVRGWERLRIRFKTRTTPGRS